MQTLWTKCAGALVTAYVASTLCASADFSGHFFVAGPGEWVADSAGSSVTLPLSSWVLDGSGDDRAILQSSGSGGSAATSVTLSAEVGAWADFGIANTTPTPFAVSFGWSGGLEHIGDQFAYYLDGIPTVLASGTGTAALYSSVAPVSFVLPIGQTFSWRVTSALTADSQVSSAFTLLTTVVVPEPSAAVLALLGLSGSALRRRRRS